MRLGHDALPTDLVRYRMFLHWLDDLPRHTRIGFTNSIDDCVMARYLEHRTGREWWVEPNDFRVVRPEWRGSPFTDPDPIAVYPPEWMAALCRALDGRRPMDRGKVMTVAGVLKVIANLERTYPDWERVVEQV